MTGPAPRYPEMGEPVLIGGHRRWRPARFSYFHDRATGGLGRPALVCTTVPPPLHLKPLREGDVKWDMGVAKPVPVCVHDVYGERWRYPESDERYTYPCPTCTGIGMNRDGKPSTVAAPPNQRCQACEGTGSIVWEPYVSTVAE